MGTPQAPHIRRSVQLILNLPSRTILKEAASSISIQQFTQGAPLAEVLNSSTPPAGRRNSRRPVEPAKQTKWFLWRSAGVSLVTYLLDSEVHTFAFSVAANAILSFIPSSCCSTHWRFRLPLSGNGGRSKRYGEVLPGLESGLCRQEPCLHRIAPWRAGLLPGHDSGRLHRHLSSP